MPTREEKRWVQLLQLKFFFVWYSQTLRRYWKGALKIWTTQHHFLMEIKTGPLAIMSKFGSFVALLHCSSTLNYRCSGVLSFFSSSAAAAALKARETFFVFLRAEFKRFALATALPCHNISIFILNEIKCSAGLYKCKCKCTTAVLDCSFASFFIV